MTAEKEHIEIFQSELIAEKVLRGLTFRLYSNRIFFVTIPRFEKIGMDMFQLGYDFLEENGGANSIMSINSIHFRTSILKL